VVANCSSRPVAVDESDLPSLTDAEVLVATHPGRTGLSLEPWESRIYAL
jgi:oligo-1,6-glucosidase